MPWSVELVVAVPNNEPVAVVVPVIFKLPFMVVEPVIAILLPDILVRRYTKLPSPSLYSSGEPLTVTVFPVLAREEERNINPMKIYIYYV